MIGALAMIPRMLGRLMRALARHKVRLALGFACGLASVVVGLVLQLVVLEWQHVPYGDLQLAEFQGYLLVAGPIVGVLVAYARR